MPMVRQPICRSCNSMLIRLANERSKQVNWSFTPSQPAGLYLGEAKERNKQTNQKWWRWTTEYHWCTVWKTQKLTFWEQAGLHVFLRWFLRTIRFSQRNGQTVSHFKTESKSETDQFSVSMKGRQQASQRQTNSQCQHERETASKSETDQFTVSAWKGDRQQVRNRSVHSVSMKGRQKASQRQIDGRTQEWWTERQEHREEGQRKRERKKIPEK